MELGGRPSSLYDPARVHPPAQPTPLWAIPRRARSKTVDHVHGERRKVAESVPFWRSQRAAPYPRAPSAAAPPHLTSVLHAAQHTRITRIGTENRTEYHIAQHSAQHTPTRHVTPVQLRA
eukprot:1032545-Rhodomonas_salina.1